MRVSRCRFWCFLESETVSNMIWKPSVTATPTRAPCGLPSGPIVPITASLRARMYDSNSALSMITCLRRPRAPSTAAVCRDLPDVRPRITNRRSSVTVRHVRRSFDRFGARGNCPPVGLVCILDVDIKEGWYRLAHTAAVTDHHDRISNSDFRWCSAAQFATRVEHGSQKSQEAGDIVGEDSWGHGVPAVRLESVHSLPIPYLRCEFGFAAGRLRAGWRGGSDMTAVHHQTDFICPGCGAATKLCASRQTQTHLIG